MTKRKLSIRTAERLIRNAYALEELAGRLRDDHQDYYADSVRSLASGLGRLGRTMRAEAEEERRK
jgi:hypothetical protein